MSFTAERLFELLPTVYRVRDAEATGAAGADAGVLRAFIDVIAEQVAVLEADIDQLYDDQFIETCAEWVAPYIGDLIGYRTLYGVGDRIGSPRAEVANTIAYRRRKGTASMLEQVARDVTGWDARVVEFFQLLATTQYMNHPRPRNLGWIPVRSSETLAVIGTPFDVAAHTADVRRIARGRGRHNIPNVGIYAWRIADFALTGSPATKLVANANDRRYLFSPLGANLQLFSHALPEETITHLAERSNVPMPISRREMWDRLEAFYPGSLSVSLGGAQLPASVVSACDLSDAAAGWAYSSDDTVLVDPLLGRLALPKNLIVDGQPVPTTDPIVSFHYGFPSEMGGGAYARGATFAEQLEPVVPVTAPASIGSAVSGLGGSGVVELRGNGHFKEALSIAAAAGARIEVRAADGVRPTVELTANLTIDVADDAEVTLNGLVITGAAVRVPAAAKRGRLRLVHCTLVPGLSLNVDGTPAKGSEPSLVVASDEVTVVIDHSIVGGIRAHEDARLLVNDSIVDATDPAGVAYAALDGKAAGGEIDVVATTVIGKVNARILRLVSNAILDARLAQPDTWAGPVLAERRQEGCVRFSYVPPGSSTPRRFECRPADDDEALRVQPQFTSERYGDAAYCQLSGRTPAEIRTGADDESEMGAFHGLFGPQRETNLQVRLEEYLRFGLEAGIFHAS